MDALFSLTDAVVRNSKVAKSSTIESPNFNAS